MEVYLEVDNSNGYPEYFLVDDMDGMDYDMITDYLMVDLNMELYDFEEEADSKICTLYHQEKEFKLIYTEKTGLSIYPIEKDKADNATKLATKDLANLLFTELKGVFD